MQDDHRDGQRISEFEDCYIGFRKDGEDSEPTILFSFFLDEETNQKQPFDWNVDKTKSIE